MRMCALCKYRYLLENENEEVKYMCEKKGTEIKKVFKEYCDKFREPSDFVIIG